MLELAAKTFLLDENSVFLVLILSALAFVITKLAIDNPLLAFASFPAYFFGAMYASVAVRELGFFASTDKVANLAFACGIGFMVAILGLVLTYRVFTAVFSR